jgi:hypothetical protein
MKIDNATFNADDSNYQDQQQRQVAALRDFYRNERTGLRILDADELFFAEELTTLVVSNPLDAFDIAAWLSRPEVKQLVHVRSMDYVDQKLVVVL